MKKLPAHSNETAPPRSAARGAPAGGNEISPTTSAPTSTPTPTPTPAPAGKPSVDELLRQCVDTAFERVLDRPLDSAKPVFRAPLEDYRDRLTFLRERATRIGQRLGPASPFSDERPAPAEHRVVAASARDADTLRTPGFAVFLVTEVCAFRCVACENWKLKRDPRELTIDEWKRAASQFRDLAGPGVEINIGGGEPLQKPGVVELVEHVTGIGLDCSLVTNGWLLSDDVASRLARAGLPKLALSLDGFRSETHDLLRGITGSHRRVMNAIDRFSRLSPGTSITLQFILMGGNFPEAVDLLDWAQNDDRVDGVYYMAVMQPHHTALVEHWRRDPRFADLWPRDLDMVDRVLDRLGRGAAAGGKVANSPGQIEAFRDYFHRPQRFIKSDGCNMEDSGVNVNSVGEVFVCMNLRAVGNLRDAPLRELYYSGSAWDRRDEIRRCDKNCEFVVNCFYEDEGN